MSDDTEEWFDAQVKSLIETSELLNRAYNAAHEDLKNRGFAQPLLAQDTGGRYILLDSLTALTNAKSALLNATL